MGQNQSASSTSSAPGGALSPTQQRMYSLEKEENFRWIFKLVAARSSYSLGERDLVQGPIQQELAEIAQFAELAHGSNKPEIIWRHLEQLVQPDLPLHGYNALTDSSLISVFRGKVSDLQGYISHRPSTKQLLIAFSGTSSGAQAMQDLKTWLIPYPLKQQGGGLTKPRALVHAGFWQLYQGIRSLVMGGLQGGMLACGPLEEVVFTAHSMGAVIAYLTLLELLDPTSEVDVPQIPQGVKLKLVIFGSPRAGNQQLVQHWRQLVDDYRSRNGQQSFVEWSVKGFNDGVTALPLTALGYRHFASKPMYLYHGQLFHVPESECECSLFAVSLPSNVLSSPEHPLGGHNYYGGRDMEKLQRLMRWAVEAGLGGVEHWTEAFLTKLKEADAEWERRQRPWAPRLSRRRTL